MARLLAVDVSGSGYDVHELTGLEFAVNLERLDLRGNRIVDLGPLSDLRRLSRIELDDNDVIDLSPLSANESLAVGDQVFLAGNPLSAGSISESIPQLESRGAFVGFRDDHGNTNSAATPLILGEPSAGGIGSSFDTDYFRFEIATATDIAIFTTGANTRGDLQTGRGLSLASDSSSGALDNFLIRRDLQPGNYYVRVRGARGPYTLHVVEGAPVRIRDASLRARVRDSLGDAARDGISSTELATLTGALNARGQGIRDLDGLEFAVNLTSLNLSRNRFLADLTHLSSLVGLGELDIERTGVTDITPLVANLGLAQGDKLFLYGSPLSDESVNVAIPALEDRGVFVGHADGHGDDFDEASALALGDAVWASIYPAKDQDVFRIELDAATDVVLYTTGDVDASVVVYNAQRREIATYADAGQPQDAQIARALSAGVYYVLVRATDETARGPYVVHAHEDPNATILPDSNLRAVVADALNKPPEAPITSADLATMTSLEAEGSGITNLTGLELAVNLTRVHLGGNRIVNIEPLSHLRALRELRLEDNRISDVGALVMNDGLGHGDRVFLQGNRLSRTASEQTAALIARGVSVVFADDHGNRPSEAVALPLGGSLAASIHRAWDEDYFRLTAPDGLTEVAVFTTGDVDLLGTLSDSRGQRLAADDDGGSARNFLMRAVLVPDHYFIKVEGFEDAAGTYMVHAIVDERVDIPDSRLLSHIERFYVGPGNPVSTGDLASIQVLDAPNARISDLDGLGTAVNLRHLSLRNNAITDLGPLSGMTMLAELDLEGNDITDVSALVGNSGLGSGDKVILAGNPLSATAQDTQLPDLEEKGVFVGFADDHGDRTGTATVLAPGGSAAGTLSHVDDEDVFRLELSEATDVAIYTTGPTDTVGRLAAAGAGQAAADSDSGHGANFIIRRRLGAGVHYATVSGSRGFAGVGPYVFHATVVPMAAPENITVLRDGSSLVVTWDPVPDDLAGGTITRYRVLATPSDGGEPVECTASPNADGCTIVGLADGVDYTVTVRAINAVGFGPVGTFAPPPEPIVADAPLPNFWRGWRLSLATPAQDENVDE